MEAQQCVELTSTNRSCGLTYLKGNVVLSLSYKTRPGTSGSEVPRFDEASLRALGLGGRHSQRTLHKVVGGARFARTSWAATTLWVVRSRVQSRAHPPLGAHWASWESTDIIAEVLAMVRRRLRTLSKVSGGDIEKATPDPIPNSEVKLLGADGTAYASRWESRTLPGLFQERPTPVDERRPGGRESRANGPHPKGCGPFAFCLPHSVVRKPTRFGFRADDV